MWIDKLAEFAAAAALQTGAQNTTTIGNQIDLQVARDIGSGEPLYLVLQVETAVAGTPGALTELRLVSDVAESLASAPVTHFSTGPLALATLVKGFTIVVALPLEGIDYKRYLGITATVTTQNLSAGKINAFLTRDPHKIEYYPGVTPH